MFATFFYILVFPGFIFLSLFALFAEYVDRILYARLQNRVGPPWFQPFADFIKMLGKEDIVPARANPWMFTFAPLFSLTAAVTAFMYIPLWRNQFLCSFQGDLIIILYLLTIPTLAFFIGGWYSTSLFARIGSVRTITQLFAYEVPLFMSVLSAALLSDSWALKDIMTFYHQHPFYSVLNIIGFGVALVSLLAKLEKAPFDIPEAETEIVAGWFTEYSGRLLAFLKLTVDVEMIVGCSLIAAVFLPFGSDEPTIGFFVYIFKVFIVVSILALLRTVLARLRIDQMITFCWRYLVPLAMLQLLLNLVIKGFVG